MTKSAIEWTGRSDWNPIRGCTRASEGCGSARGGGCYAEIMAARFSQPAKDGKPAGWGHGFAHMVDTPQGRDHRWTGKVELQLDRLTLPLGWKQPGFVFPSSTSDIFHEALSDDEIDQIMAVIALTPHLIYQLLTKRAARMRAYFADEWRMALIEGMAQSIWHERTGDDSVAEWLAVCALPNLWLGTSVEDQRAAEERLPELAQITEGALRWVSFEPLIGRVDASPWMPSISWAVVGGESGPGARDNDFQANARFLLAQCTAAGVPFFGKQDFKKRELPADLQIRQMPA